MLPEGFIGAVVVFPVGLHIGEEGGGAVGLEDLRDVFVLAAFVAVFAEGAIAVIRR